jgi:hypothetical protein
MRGIQVLPYFCHLLSERAPEWGAFGPKMRVIPEDRLESHFKWEPQEAGDKVCCRSLFQDYLVDGIARLMDEYDVDGVYLDGIPCPWPCKNPLHGCGYTRPDGSVHVTYPIFAVRETVRRIYTVVKSRKPDGEVCIHTSSAMPAPVMAWSTSQLTGEQFGQGAYDFPEDDASLPIFRTMCMAPQWGVPAEFVPWTLGWSYRKASAFTLLHDVLAEPDTGDLELESKLWRLSDEFGRKNAEWLPYWRNAEYVKVTPKGAYASLYKYPRNGVLAVVSNLSRANATVHVQLDFEKLELRKDATIKDSLTGEPLALQNGEVELNLAPLGWKIVWLK